MTAEQIERKRAWSAAYYLKNRAKILARNELWWKTHRDKLRDKWRRKRIRCKDKIKLIKRNWCARHQEHVRKKKLEWKNSDRGIKTNREWYRRNADKIKERARIWYRNNPGHHAISRLRRTNRLKSGLVGNPKSINIFMNGVRSKRFARYYYCDKKVRTNAIHFDHIIPLSKGGPHSVENLCVSCPRCNLSKRARLIEDWMILGQQVLAL